MQLASYAKINLFLEILAKRPDGYHQIETLLCSVSVCDTLKYALTKKPGLKLWSNLPEMAAADNLILRIANYLADKYKPDQGVEIFLDKKIPVAAGLGGGSSNAANALIALNSLWGLNLTQAELESVAAGFGSDICFFLTGGTAWATERGEQIEPRDDLEISNILLVNPGIGISSSRAYQLSPIPSSGQRRHFRQPNWHKCLFNRLEAAVRLEYPVVDQLLTDLYEQGANAALMSGSGATCFGIFDDAGKMSSCQGHFERQGFWTQITRTISRKEYQDVFEA